MTVPAPSVATARAELVAQLATHVGCLPADASLADWQEALALLIRGRLSRRWLDTEQAVRAERRKRVYYLSMEFLIGRLLGDALNNLGLADTYRQALADLGVDYDAVLGDGSDPALGNGGLGRLAACFLDSMATLGIASHGYGIRFDHGLFRQSFDDGWQVEAPEDWLEHGHTWDFVRPQESVQIGFGGNVGVAWEPSTRVIAVPYDVPVAGWRASHVNTLRLWSPRSTEGFDLNQFNSGQHVEAATAEVVAQGIGRVLYPGDDSDAGRALRLRQEYFFTAASIADIVSRHQRDHGDLRSLPQGAAIQLNDTHPAIAVPELVRQLHDAHGMSFDAAVDTARGCISYTNHTLLPEALESWPRPLFGALLPRHMQIVERLDQRATADTGTRLVDYHGAGNVLMGNVAFFGSHRVNGVSALHTELMKQTVFSELHSAYPNRIVNQTNGVTPRRWLAGCNRGLATLLDGAIGEGWVTDLESLKALEPSADDAGFREQYAAVKLSNKQALAREVKRRTGISVPADAMFDVQVKRLHEYKRQLLNILETVAHYRALKAGTAPDGPPRVRLFAGKAAPSYHVAKRIIKLINDVAVVVNADPATNDRLRVAFLPDYNVSLAELIMPAADLSEQISTAGMEASGTGNMKLGLNGALTIGTLDGANVEMAEQVGRENIFIFGLEANEVYARRDSGRDARANIAASEALRDVFGVLRSGDFSGGDKERYDDVLGGIEHGDYFMVSDDFDAYARMQREVDVVFSNTDEWMRRAVLNTARLGWFSSDRTIASYAHDIWGVTPQPALPPFEPRP